MTPSLSGWNRIKRSLTSNRKAVSVISLLRSPRKNYCQHTLIKGLLLCTLGVHRQVSRHPHTLLITLSQRSKSSISRSVHHRAFGKHNHISTPSKLELGLVDIVNSLVYSLPVRKLLLNICQRQIQTDPRSVPVEI
jgi:hypothetical protein